MWGDLLQTHGYWVLALGCLLEGETVLLIAGFAAHRGYLDPWFVVAIAATSAFAGDEAYFWLGRLRGRRILDRWPSIAARSGALDGLLQRRGAAVIVGLRFAYGLRVAGPLLIGMSGISALRFGLLNALGALFWAGIVGAAGWLFGEAAQALLGKVRHVEGWLLLLLLVVGVAIIWIRRRHAARI